MEQLKNYTFSHQKHDGHMDFTQALNLSDERVLLRPYASTDLAQLALITQDEDIWRYMPTRISNQEELATWVQAVEKGRAQGTRYTFMIEDRATGQLAGSTSYGNVSLPDRRLEIGWTWLTKPYRGSGLNRHCKFLLLQYAFEVLDFERVELKTDVLNTRSRKAMLKIGATEEGVLRSHTQLHDGRRRDTIYYSILRPEWAQVKQRYFGDLSAQRPV
ncbi:RimJ/RimL family protein N-acetyltransferase [Pontibacter ummariensis]|uniref:Protein N-acetyltransferase, RimJ/RimL family n=1 Tax=Pontibacter ummariensis TaxID=1610492 RepID=A0A239KHC4_9BACT|nr:GNAT family protein [Pontibacter ummariensis]PRY05733.1 RimJ/RimL family protein N-acetyltransferase [Pontibacter ummariensis]SNT17757.1 Protein N-acetyltransferase, RimJ/RimL family [Pontibacter ummariensis]